MAWKLIYTSAPRLLQAGRSGFGTVARHREIPPLVAETAEKSSQFSRQTGLDSARVIFAYRLARSSAGTFHLLTRIADAGTDYSGRTNHLAEHLILSDQEAAKLGAEGYTPAGVMLAYEWAGYEGQARWLGYEDLWQPSATDANTSGSHWQAATTDPNRVKLLASAEAQSGAVLEYPAHYQSEAHPWILWLFAESQCLCPQSGWGITFTTNVQPTDSLSDFRWLGAPDNSPILQKLQGSGRPLFNFSTEAPKTFVRTPDAREPAPISVPEGAVRSAASMTRGPDVVKAGPPPKRPRAVERRTGSYKLLYTLLSLLIVALVAGFWWFLPADAPAPPEAPKPSNLSTQANAEEPRVTSIPPEKAPQPEVNQQNDEGAAAVTSKLIDTEKTPEPASVSMPDLTSEKKSITSAPPQLRPSRTLILFPHDSWERLNWPDTWSSENLKIVMIDQSGKRETLKAPGRFESGGVYKTDAGVQVFRAAGQRKLPTERIKNDAYIFDLSSTKYLDETWRIYVMPDDRPLQAVVPSDDPLMLNNFVIAVGAESSFLKFDTTDLVFAEFSAFIREQSGTGGDAGSPALVLEASFPEPKSIQSARSQEIAPGQTMIDKATAESINLLRIPLDDKGQLIVEEAKKPFNQLDNAMKKISNRPSNKPSDILSEVRALLLNSLQKIAKSLESKKTSDKAAQPLLPQGKLTEIPQNLKSEEMDAQLQKLTGEYFDALDFLIPGGDNSELQEHLQQALENVQNKKYLDAGKSAELFLQGKRRQPKNIGMASFDLQKEEKALQQALNLFARRSSDRVTDYQRELAGTVIRELTQALPCLFATPPKPPDLNYSLKISRGSAARGPEYVITENIRVRGAEGSQVTPKP